MGSLSFYVALEIYYFSSESVSQSDWAYSDLLYLKLFFVFLNTGIYIYSIDIYIENFFCLYYAV